MRQNKQISTSNKEFAKGGKHHMFGRSGVGPQEAGVTSTTRNPGSAGKLDGEVTWAKGGPKVNLGKQSVKAAKPL